MRDVSIKEKVNTNDAKSVKILKEMNEISMSLIKFIKNKSRRQRKSMEILCFLVQELDVTMYSITS